jgi:hypothetical protein
MTEENVNMDGVKVEEGGREPLTDLQEYGISSTIVKLLGDLRKYLLLTQVQIDLQQKSHQIQPIMRELYQYEEMKLIMDIRTDMDTVYAYTRDKIVITNMEVIRNKFENNINFLASNMGQVKSVLDKAYTDILDDFLEKMKKLTDDIATKSIYDEHFKLQ